MKNRDTLTGDLFAAIPKADDSAIADFKVRMSLAMSRALKNCPGDRYEVAARMSRILGREVTKAMIDAYTAGSKETHIPNLQWSIAFDAATDQHELLNLYASLRGCTVLVGADALRARLGKLDLDEQRIRTERREIKECLKGSKS